jgi:DNA-binding PadR family transcriptional regulator
MQIYKSNLSILNNSYSDFEQRILKVFSENKSVNQIWLPGELDIMLMYLLQDGMLVDTGQNSGIIMSGMPSQKLYSITEKGKTFIQKWLSAEEL